MSKGLLRKVAGFALRCAFAEPPNGAQVSILDEADQMLSVGFEEDVEKIYARMPKERTNYLFSATMPFWVKKLASKCVRTPGHPSGVLALFRWRCHSSSVPFVSTTQY